MKRLSKVFAILIAVSALLIAACGDDDDEAGNGSVSPTAGGSPSATNGDETPDASPDGTEQPVPTLTLSPTSNAPTPTPRAPSLDAGVKKIGEGTMTFSLVPGSQFPVDGYGLIQPGTTPPSCAAFVFAFTWQVTDPFPPGANRVTWRITRQDGTEDVGSGAAGTATVGCGQLTATNDGADAISVSVWYVQGETQS